MSARTRILPVALITALLAGSGAHAQVRSVTTTTTATTSITEAATIRSTGELIFQDLVITPAIHIGPVVSASQTSNLTVLGADAVSLAVPQFFDLTREGGMETLTVVTTAGGGYAIAGLQGMAMRSGALSIYVGGTIRVRADQLAPGEYRGLLVVVAQYN